MMTDVLLLRTTLVCGYSGLVLFHLLHPQPLRIPLRWSSAFVLVNAIAAAKLAADRWPAAMSEEDEELYLRSFSQMTRGEPRAFPAPCWTQPRRALSLTVLLFASCFALTSVLSVHTHRPVHEAQGAGHACRAPSGDPAVPGGFSLRVSLPPRGVSLLERGAQCDEPAVRGAVGAKKWVTAKHRAR